MLANFKKSHEKFELARAKFERFRAILSFSHLVYGIKHRWNRYSNL